MDSYKEMYESICRICLTYNRSKYKICLVDKKSEDGLSCFGKSVLTFANITLNKNDTLPLFMCSKCLKLLKHAIYFKLRCEKTHKQLLDWKETYKKNEQIGTTIEEVIVQNIMYSYYFPDEGTSKYNNVKGNQTKSHIKEKKCHQSNEHNEIDIDLNLPQENIENTKECKDDDSEDELLSVMEKSISENDYISPTDHNMCVQQNTIHKNHISIVSRRAILKQKHLKRNNKVKQSSNSTNTDKFTCDICNKEMANPNTLRNHMQQHTGFKYICEHCGKGFPVLAELQLHRVARHGSGPYLQCEHCHFKAPTKHVLIEHVRLHTGERPYTCDKCGLTFRRRAIWSKHLIYHTEKSVQCEQCPRKFFRRSEMLAHMNNMHERLYLYLCHICDVMYAKTTSVRKHLTERHGIAREMQGKIIRIRKVKGYEK